MRRLSAADIIRLLDLRPHPEGGHYRQTFRDSRTIDGGRAASTAIYFLLARGERSHWHRVDAVEVWHHYAGAPLSLSIAGVDGTSVVRLGADIAAGEQPQAAVPADAWQAAESLGRLDAGRLHGGAGVRIHCVRAGSAGLVAAFPVNRSLAARSPPAVMSAAASASETLAAA